VKTTGIFTIHKHEFFFKKYNEPILIIPFGDIHRTAPLCHVEKWKEWVEWAKTLKNVHFLGMGDYDDFSSTSERDILSNRSLHESTKYTLDSLYRKHTTDLANELSFMKGRLIGCLEGNHYSELTSGITTTQLLCDKLECKYLGVSSFIKLLMTYTAGQTHALDIWAHHGLGGGRTVGASINKLENMIKAADADIYLMAHDHRKSLAMVSRLKLTDGRNGLSLENRKILMARTGGFLRGYVDGQPSYIADSAYSPVDIGTITITVTPKRFCPYIRKSERKGVCKTGDKRWVEVNGSI